MNTPNLGYRAGAGAQTGAPGQTVWEKPRSPAVKAAQGPFGRSASQAS